MKRFALFLLVVAGFVSSCKKSGGGDVTPTDPRDRMVGSYAVGGNVAISTSTLTLTPVSFSGTVGVTKSTTASQLYLDFDLPSGKERVTAGLKDNNNFAVLDKTTEQININGQIFTGQYTATGQFTDKNEFIFTGVSQDKDLKKITTITGTKK